MPRPKKTSGHSTQPVAFTHDSSTRSAFPAGGVGGKARVINHAWSILSLTGGRHARYYE
ncbi:MAG TPA: hypothetical protein VMV83_05080 [Rectinemataceae bacterium]|nr:hypothetical protein [Rectinemataceae bacterium]